MSVKQRTPAQENLSFLGDDLLEDLHSEGLLGRVWRGEERTHAIGPGAPRAIPKGLQRSFKSSWGIWIKIPAPSPVLFSQPQAPR